jgi:hypothetical protein
VSVSRPAVERLSRQQCRQVGQRWQQIHSEDYPCRFRVATRGDVGPDVACCEVADLVDNSGTTGCEAIRSGQRRSPKTCCGSDPIAVSPTRVAAQGKAAIWMLRHQTEGGRLIAAISVIALG